MKQYVGKSNGVVSVLSLDTLDVKVLDKLPADYTAGQVCTTKS